MTLRIQDVDNEYRERLEKWRVNVATEEDNRGVQEGRCMRELDMTTLSQRIARAYTTVGRDRLWTSQGLQNKNCRKTSYLNVGGTSESASPPTIVGHSVVRNKMKPRTCSKFKNGSHHKLKPGASRSDY